MTRVERRRALVAVAIVVLAACAPLRGDDAAPSPWHEGLRDALAGAEGKPVALLFTTDDCVWCHRLLADSAADAGVREVLAQVVGIHVRAEDERALAARLHVRAYPTLVLVSRGRRLVRAVEGYLPPADLATTLRVLALHGDADAGAAIDLGARVDVAALAGAPDGVPVMIAALGHGDLDVRRRLREALAARADGRDALWAALDDGDLGVRVDAAAALAEQVGAPATYDPFTVGAARSAGIERWRRDAAAVMPGGVVP